MRYLVTPAKVLQYNTRTYTAKLEGLDINKYLYQLETKQQHHILIIKWPSNNCLVIWSFRAIWTNSYKINMCTWFQSIHKATPINIYQGRPLQMFILILRKNGYHKTQPPPDLGYYPQQNLTGIRLLYSSWFHKNL